MSPGSHIRSTNLLGFCLRLYAQIGWGENTKVNCELSNADQDRRNVFLVGGNRWLYSNCQLGRPCSLRVLGDQGHASDFGVGQNHLVEKFNGAVPS
jgi:hypothetical protein